MSTKHQLIRIRRGTAAEWSASLPQPGGEVLKLGEPGYEKDTGKLKIGDGTTPWNSLAYFNSGATIDPEELQDLIGDGGFLVSGSGINIDYDDNANTLTISNTKETYDAAVDWTPNHTLVDGTRYLIGDLVYQSGHLYKANYENESMPVSNTTYWTDLGTGYRLNIDGRDIQNIPYPVKDVVAGADISVENTSGIYTISSSSTINTDTLEPDGFVNRNDSQIAFNDGSREFSISPKFPATSYGIYNNGTKIIKTTTETTTLPNETALYFLHFDKSNNQLSYKTTGFNFDTDIPIAQVYYNADDGKAVYFGEERHGIRMDASTHRYLHNVFGTQYINGLSISNYSTSGTGSSNSDATIAIGDGLIYDEDIEASISHSDSPVNPFEQVLYPIAQIPVYYKVGASGIWTDTTPTDYPVKTGTTIQYNLDSAGTWSASDSPNPTNNRYIAYWICATTQENAPVISIMGQRIDSSLLQAQSNNAWGNLNLTGLPIVELRPLYRLIYDTKNDLTNDPKGYLVDILDIRSHIDTVTGLTQNDHGSLYGLADDDHYQYVHIDNGRTINAVHTFINGITFGDSTTQLSASPFVTVDSTNLQANINSNSLSVNHGNNYCAILGGNSNTISNSSYYSTIVGGNTNFIGHGTNCAILGGYQNSINDINFTGNILSDCFIYGSNNIIESNSITTNCGILGTWNKIQHGHNSAFIIGHGINLMATNGSEDRCLFVNSLRIMDNGAGVKFPDGSLQTTAYTGGGGNPFDQDLNTFNSPTFNTVAVTGSGSNYMTVSSSGLAFPDGTVQTTAGGGGNPFDWTLIINTDNTVSGYNLTSIGNNQFENSNGISLRIGDSVSSIADYGFNGCSNFTGNLNIPNSVTTIGSYAFYNCSGFSGNLTIGNSVTSIGDYAFYNCGFTGNLTIGNSVTSIGNGAFFSCSGFSGNLTIGNSVTSIGSGAFYNCSGLSGNLNIPNSVTSIGSDAFNNCSGLSGDLNIPNSVTSIGNSAFYNCYGLSGNLTIGNSVTNIGDYAFYNCSGLSGDLTIGNSVTSIGNYAFNGCSNFTGNLTIGNSVTSIGDYAFNGCSNFTGNLTIGNSVTSIGNSAFSGCSGLSGNLTIGNSVTSIGNSAFYNCSGLSGNLTIGNSVTSIGSYAFNNCSGLSNVNCYVPLSVFPNSNEFSGCTFSTFHVLSSDSSWTDGETTLGNHTFTVIKDL